MMAEHLDYVSAMVYPSHWAPGEYGVANPNRAAVRHRPALAPGLQEGRPRHGRTRRPVAPGLLARRRLRPGAGSRGDPGGERRRESTSTSSGTLGHLHRRRAPHRARRRPKFPTTARRTLTRHRKPDELGVVPVLMHHQLRLHGSAYDMTAVAVPRRADAALARRLLPGDRRVVRRPGGWTCRRASPRS